MAVDPSVKIDIAAEFTGKKAFDKAGKSTSSLEKNVKNLAKTFGLAFGGQAVLNFAKSSAKAFIEDDNAARSLGVTIKNLGLEYGNNTTVVSQFIDNLEKQTGILDDELRPAMDRLLRATGSVTKSQELLNLSLDIAAGTGKTVTQVSQSLQKAYLGQNAAIGRLGVGISKAELATGDFADIQEKLTKLFAGQAATAANSYAGQLNKLQVAANNAKETIGKGLVDALKLLSEDTTIDELNTGLEETSLYIADLIRGVGVFIQKLKEIPVAGTAFQIPLEGYIGAIPVLGFYINTLRDLGKEARLLASSGGGGGFTDSQNAARLADEKKAKAAAAKAAAAQAAELKAAKTLAAAKIAADKKAAANKAILAKADSIFNIEQIQIEAALKGKISDNERLRLELQRAILNEDFELAAQLQKQLEVSQRAIGALQGQLTAIKPPTNPFAETLTTLELIAELLGKVSGMPLPRKGGGILALEPDDLLPLITAPKVTPKATPTPTITEPIPVVVLPSPSPTPSTNNPFAGLGGNTMPSGGFGFSVPGYTYQPPSVTVNVTVEGNVLDGDDFTEKVNDALLNANRTGLPRTAAGFLVDAG